MEVVRQIPRNPGKKFLVGLLVQQSHWENPNPKIFTKKKFFGKYLLHACQSRIGLADNLLVKKWHRTHKKK
jgi:hypothetical protein